MYQYVNVWYNLHCDKTSGGIFLNILKEIISFSTIVILISIIVMTIHIYRKLFYRRKKSIENEIKALIENGLISDKYYENLKLNKIIIKSADNLNLAGYLIKCENPIGCIILSHGISCNHATMLWRVEIFKRKNYDVLLIDQRGYGNSSPAKSTYGFKESNDIVLWIKYLKNLNYDKVGILGHSMGASIALLTCNEVVKPDFVISESAYSNLHELVKFQLRSKKIPIYILVTLVSIVCKILNGFMLSDINVLKAIENTKVPILFIHGNRDNLTPCHMSNNMAKASNNKIFIIDNCNHYLVENIKESLCEYEKVIGKFLSTI